MRTRSPQTLTRSTVVAALLMMVATLLAFTVPSARAQDFRSTKGGGVTLSVPESWKPFALDTPKAQADLKAFLKANPKLGFSYDQLVKQNIVILAVGVAKNGFADNLNVIVSPAGGAKTITNADLDSLAAQYKSIGGTVTKSQLIKVKGAPAARIEYTLKANRPDGGTQIVQGTQIVVLSNNKIAFVTISQGTRDAKVVSTILGSISVS